jgi:predicted DNA-binding transcriptional regulator AlpA
MSRKSRQRAVANRKPAVPSIEQIQAHDLIDVDAMCVLVGGNRPVNRATIYRNVKAGRLPKPIRVSPNVSRWVRPAVVSVLKAMTSGAA